MRNKDGELMFPLISPPIPAPRTWWSKLMKTMHDRAKKAKAKEKDLKKVHPSAKAAKLSEVKGKAKSQMESAKVSAQGKVQEAKSEAQAAAEEGAAKSELNLSIPVNPLPSSSDVREEDGPPVAVSLTRQTAPTRSHAAFATVTHRLHPSPASASSYLNTPHCTSYHADSIGLISCGSDAHDAQGQD